ncbi:MAG: SMI1/KNR4 family protein [Candidatus Kuenenia sp.]|nr:SMI1/KNR4 family protein [Candidatus Kuenenia hertensis]
MKNKLSLILQGFSQDIKTSEPLTENDISDIENNINLKLPLPYRTFIKKYGVFQADYIHIYGYSPDEPAELSVTGLTELLRLLDPGFPLNLLPFQDLGEDRFACLYCDNDVGISSSQVVIWDGNLPGSKKTIETHEDFDDYLYRTIYSWKWWKKGLERLEWHMENKGFRYDHQAGGQLPRSHKWRPYRFCVQDVILGITAVRHDKLYNRHEVDLFLTAEIPEYEADSGCRALALIILSDAYKSGGSMEVRFTKNVEGGRIPFELHTLAKRLGIDFTHISEGGITPKESKELYLALSEFNQELREKIIMMDESGKLSAMSVAYAVHRGVWTQQEIESLIFSSSHPESLLKGSFTPEAWHLFYYDLVCCRTALMGGYLDRKLKSREYDEQNVIMELEDDERELEIIFDPEVCAKIYHFDNTDGTIIVPWLYQEGSTLEIKPGECLKVLPRAYDFDDIELRWCDDLKQAHELQLKTRLNHSGPVCIMYPADFKRLAPETIASISGEFNDKEIKLIICPDFINQLDQEVVRRMESVRIMRQ